MKHQKKNSYDKMGYAHGFHFLTLNEVPASKGNWNHGERVGLWLFYYNRNTALDDIMKNPGKPYRERYYIK